MLAPAIKSGQRLVIAAHGNSIRALVKYLDNIGDADIVGVNIPNGIPLVYELDADLKPTDGPASFFTYDEAGRLATMSDATGTTTYSYDAGDRPVREDTRRGRRHPRPQLRRHGPTPNTAPGTGRPRHPRLGLRLRR